MGRHIMGDAGVCDTCHRPMRSQYVKAADAPGTIARSGPGICVMCRDRPKKAARKDRMIPLGPPNPVLAAWRIVYEADRRNRGIPPEGLLQ